MILLVSPNAQLINQWQTGAAGLDSFEHANNHSTALDCCRDHLPDIVLLDYQLITQGEQSITELLDCSPQSIVLVFSNTLNEEQEWQLFKSGVRGFCQYDLPCEQLKRVISAVKRGELWIRRSLTYRLLDEFRSIEQKQRQLKQSIYELLETLTQRENDIVVLIKQGANNR